MSEEKDILSLSSPTLSRDNHAKSLDCTSSSSEREYEPHIPYQDSQRAQDVALPAHPDLWWSRTRHLLREPLSEFFGVFVIILFGNG
jgi:aquaglyceroporin related protein